MMKAWLLLLVCINLWAGEATLEVTLTGFKSVKGQAIVQLFSSDEKEIYPRASEKTLKRVAPISPALTATVVLKDLQPGEYAVSAIHDENGNGKMDQILGFGPPSEPVGASNNPKGMPNFETSKFRVNEGKNTIQIVVSSIF